MNVILKLLWCIFGIAVMLAIAYGCNLPGSLDEERHLAGDYYFDFSDNPRNSIVEKRGGISEEVVPVKVEEFLVHGGAIFVTRHPMPPQAAEMLSGNSPLAATCEYYRIDVATRKVHGPFALAEVKQRLEWAFLRQRKGDEDFGPTVCKLAAVND